MIFVTGGTAQGKYRYVQETFGIREAETVDAAVSASCASDGSDSDTGPDLQMMPEMAADPAAGNGDAGNVKDTAAVRILSDASVRCVVHYQDLVRALQAVGKNPEDYTRQLLKRRPDLIIVMEEIGSGIVPLEKEERFWREACGRCGCLIAADADTVVRLVCGIPTVLKGSPVVRPDAVDLTDASDLPQDTGQTAAVPQAVDCAQNVDRVQAAEPSGAKDQLQTTEASQAEDQLQTSGTSQAEGRLYTTEASEADKLLQTVRNTQAADRSETEGIE